MEEIAPINIESLKKLMGKSLRVKCADGKERRGVMYTVDPVTESLVLVSFRDNKPFDVEVIMGHSLLGVSVEGEAPLCEQNLLDELFLSKEVITNQKSSAQRKIRLMDWFKQNRVPVIETERGTLSVLNFVDISPPFVVDTCYSTNELVLSKVRALVGSLPDEQKESNDK